MRGGPKRLVKIIAVNLVLLFLIDRGFGCFAPSYSEYLNKAIYPWDAYRTNYRGYFTDKRTGPDGDEYFTIDRSKEIDRNYQGTVFVEPSVKIVAIGDSFTAGQGVRLADTWVKQLEKVPSDRKVYGLNLAVSGAGVTQIEGQLDGLGADVKPSIIIYAFMLNDTVIAPTSENFTLLVSNEGTKLENDYPLTWDLVNMRVPMIKQRRGAVLSFFCEHSRIVEYITSQLERRELSRSTIQHYRDLHDPAKNPLGLEQTFAAIERMQAAATKRHAPFLVVIFPIFFQIGPDYPLRAVHTFMRRSLAERGIDVLDLLPAYDGYEDYELWVHPVDQHPNDLAQRLTAGRIEKRLRHHGILR